MNLRITLFQIVLNTLILLTPCLAGTFGQTQQLFAQYGIGGPAQTIFSVHNPGEAEIIVRLDFFNPDGSVLGGGDVTVPAGGSRSFAVGRAEAPLRDGWARMTSEFLFNATRGRRCHRPGRGQQELCGGPSGSPSARRLGPHDF